MFRVNRFPPFVVSLSNHNGGWLDRLYRLACFVASFRERTTAQGTTRLLAGEEGDIITEIDTMAGGFRTLPRKGR
jgi:hypothetical protein